MVQVYFQCSHCSEKKLVMSTNAFDLDDGLDLEELINEKGKPKKTLKGEDTGSFHKEDVYSNEAFFYSLDQVSRYALNRCTILDDKATLEDLIDAYDDLLDSLTKYLKKEVEK